MNEAQAKIVLAADARRLRRDLAREERNFKRWGRRSAASVTTGFKSALGSLASLASAAGLATIGQTAFKNKEALTRMSIQASRDLGSLDKLSRTLADNFGMLRGDVLGASSALVDLMGAGGASAQNMRLLAQAATATGAPVQDLAGVLYGLDNAFKFTSAADARQAISGVIEAGKQGSIPLGQMSVVLQQQATNLAKVTTTAGDAAAMLQVIRRGFGSATEAGTGLKAMVNSLISDAPKLRKLGIDVDVKDGKIQDFDGLLDRMAEKNLTGHKHYTKTIGSAEARTALEVLLQQRAVYERIRKAAAQSNALQEDSAKFLESNAGRMRRALATVHNELEALFTAERLHTFTDGVRMFARAVGFAVDNLKSLTAAVGVFYGLRLATQVMSVAKAAAALDVGLAGAATSLGAMTRQGAQVSGLAKAMGVLQRGAAAFAAAGTIGFSVGTLIAEGLGIGEDTSASNMLDANKRALAQRRGRLTDSDAFMQRALSGEVAANAPRSIVLRRREEHALASKVQAGTASDADIERLRHLSDGQFVAPSERLDIEKDTRALEVAVARGEATKRNAARLERFDGKASGRVALGLVRGELRGGDGTITRDEIRSQLEQRNLLPELEVKPGMTGAEIMSRQAAAIERMVEHIAQLVPTVQQQMGSLAEGITVKIGDEVVVSTVENSSAAMRGPTP